MIDESSPGVGRMKDSEGQSTTKKKKGFEFRERLWYEPPEGQELDEDYSFYECFHVVQKDLKEKSRKDLRWKSRWVDLYIELVSVA